MLKSRLLGAVGIVVVVSSLAAALTAQAPAGPSFEVASVKRDVSGQQKRGIGLSLGGRFTATNVPLRALIRFAFPIQNYQLIGGPDWVNTEFYDVAAKAPDAMIETTGRTTDEALRRMLQGLLADRFHLAVHQETRDLPIYILTVARGDGALGPSIHRSEIDCDALRKSGVPPPEPAAGQAPVCGGRAGAGLIAMNGFPLSQLALNLSTWTERFVVDRTGLTGAFNYQLQWAIDQMPMFDQLGAPSQPPASLPDPSGPSLFTAVQEQLGLKLESSRGPVDVLLIDRVEHPTEN